MLISDDKNNKSKDNKNNDKYEDKNNYENTELTKSISVNCYPENLLILWKYKGCRY